MTGATLRDGSLSEAAFQQQVVEYASLQGWMHYHPPDNKPTRSAGGRLIRQRVTPGFPDLVLVRDDEMILAELKAEKGRAGKGQAEWLNALAIVADGNPRIGVYFWRPSDWLTIEDRLKRRPVSTESPVLTVELTEDEARHTYLYLRASIIGMDPSLKGAWERTLVGMTWAKLRDAVGDEPDA